MAILTTTANYPDDLFRINSFFNGVGQGSVRYSSPTTIVLGTSDLNRIVINGYGLQYDHSQANPWVAGTITSIALWDLSYDKKVAEISGLNMALSDVGPKFGIDMYSSGGLIGYLFGGSDIFVGSANGDSFYAHDGNDTVNSGAGDDDITPGSGADIVNGGSGYDLVSYWNYDIPGGDEKSPGAVIDLRQSSVVDPWGHVDRLTAIEGLEGTYYSDTLTGDNNGNTLYGLAGHDSLSGLDGNDFLSGGDGVDTMDGGAGFDTVSYADYAGPGSIDVNLEAGFIRDQWGQTDVVISIESVRGTGNADNFVGSSANETFQGMGGDDTIVGGAGSDAVSYSADKTRGGVSGVVVDLAEGVARDGFGSTDRFSGIENAYGSLFGDRISGNALSNTLTGNLGRDNLDGRSGNDWLYGGAGNDTLKGNRGRDGFVFDTALNKTTNVDKIVDFSVASDTVYLDDAIFTKLKRGYLAASAFHVGPKAQDKSDRIIYDKKTGSVYYDPDGTGGAAQVKFAVLTKNLKMTYHDFIVY